MKYIKSPLNYMGGKYKLLPKLFEIFPKDINVFVDLFAGGLNVGINASANMVIVNDCNNYLIELFKFLKRHSTEDVLKMVDNRIKEFSLSKTNEDGYYALRDRYNDKKDVMDLLVLIFYSFNHQIRFNNDMKFNVSLGKNRSSYNKQTKKNLTAMCDALKEKNMVFYGYDFNDLNLSDLTDLDFVYCDPPYLISTATYNKNWTTTKETQLLELLDRLDKQGTRFALSNVLYHKGLANNILINWSKKYKVHYLDSSYSNCSYHLKDRNTKTVEVVITNY